MRLGLIGCVRRVWAPRGVKIIQPVEYKREWAYLHVAVNGLRGKLMWTWTDNMKAESIVPVVKQWSRRRVKFLVWDRARGHRGALYDSVRVQRIEQPPYAPQVNPAERIFQHLRAAIEGKIYGTLAAKKAAVEAALAHTGHVHVIGRVALHPIERRLAAMDSLDRGVVVAVEDQDAVVQSVGLSLIHI